VPFPVAFLAFRVAVECAIASSASFLIWATFSTRRACLEDRRWNAFGLVSKYVIFLTFFTAVFGNTTQLASNANTNRISTTPTLGKSWHFNT
jgi:putative Ca2+/H+ antiporter (TMEM165/GDT1 family)